MGLNGLKCCSVFAMNVSGFDENVFVFARRLIGVNRG
jgi:hypothetical protein